MDLVERSRKDSLRKWFLNIVNEVKETICEKFPCEERGIKRTLVRQVLLKDLEFNLNEMAIKWRSLSREYYNHNCLWKRSLYNTENGLEEFAENEIRSLRQVLQLSIWEIMTTWDGKTPVLEKQFLGKNYRILLCTRCEGEEERCQGWPPNFWFIKMDGEQCDGFWDDIKR